MLVINIIIMLGKMYKLVILPIFPLDPMKCPKRYPKHRENSYFSGLGGVFSGGPKQRKIAKLIFIQPLNFNSKPVWFRHPRDLEPDGKCQGVPNHFSWWSFPFQICSWLGQLQLPVGFGRGCLWWEMLRGIPFQAFQLWSQGEAIEGAVEPQKAGWCQRGNP